MSIPLERICNQMALFENYYLNLYNISLTDESLGTFLEQVRKISFLKTMITTVGISKNQQIAENHREMLKEAFINWNGVFQLEH